MEYFLTMTLEEKQMILLLAIQVNILIYFDSMRQFIQMMYFIVFQHYQLLILSMSNHYVCWDNHKNPRTSNNPSNNQKNANTLKQKLLDLNKQSMLVKHASDEQLRRGHYRVNQIRNEIQLFKSVVQHQEQVYAHENSILHKKGSHKYQQKPYLKISNHDERLNNLAKNHIQNRCTAMTEQIISHKSEKTLPSFLRIQNQRRLPQKKKIDTSFRKDRFKMLKRLGEGKFGDVYLAKQLTTGWIVALKIMQKRKILQKNLLVQFIRQIKIQTFLDHPNIIKNYSLFHDQQNFYTIMQLGCDGQLYDIISSGQTVSEECTAFIIGSLLDAVHVMHQHKILHRDIKPENIVLVHGTVKLCDFGWAVNKKEELRGTFCGTPFYLSPELIQGSKYDEKVDLWAVGILAYELHIGASPFNILQQQDLIKIVTDQVEFPKNKKISKQFKDFISAILKKNPKERMDCKQLLHLDFILKYRDLQTCEELCQ